MATSWLHGPGFNIEVASLIGFIAESWFRVVGLVRSDRLGDTDRIAAQAV
jgi:hypothetical protein